MIPPGMRAAVHTDAFQLDIRDVAVPRPSLPDHVLVRVGAVGICGSDKHDLDHPPRSLLHSGHEFAGVIAALGSEPGGFTPGERVLVRPRARCGVCAGCTGSPRTRCEWGGVYGCRGNNQPPGAMAEYVLVLTENLTHVPDEIPLEEAALTDPLAVAIHAANLAPDVSGRDCVVMGAGAIGLLLGQVLKLRGAGRVAMVDVLESHLATAALLGDFECVDSRDRQSATEHLRRFGAGIYFELAGGESPTLDMAIEAIAKEGWILLVSQRPAGAWINYQRVMFQQLTLKGVAGTSDASWKEAEHLIFTRAVQIQPIITHRYPLERANEALMTAVKGDSLKVLILPNGEVV